MPDTSPKSMILPGPEDRMLIIGRTGSGKTVLGLFVLSKVHEPDDITIIIDYKREKQIAQIPYVQYVPIGFIPTQPGIYVVQPFPTQNDEMNDYLMQIWDVENIRLYIDEGVMLARNDALDAILIQGRSKQIPVIMLTQRPVGISRFAFSESQIFVVFPSHDRRERKTISEFTPLFQTREEMLTSVLPKFHSYYFNVYEQGVLTLKPVPDMESTYRTFEKTLKPPEPAEQVKEAVKAGRNIVAI